MNRMNRQGYWKIRKTILTILFKFKVFLYRLLDQFSGNNENRSFRIAMIKSSFWGIVKVTILILIAFIIDRFLIKNYKIAEVDKNLFIPTVIGGISIAGVIWGLYCANIASIYSSKYSNAPTIIINAFQSDRLSRRCISSIVDYIEFGFSILLIMMLNIKVSWTVLCFYIVWSIAVIVAYCIAGNRAYQLTDIYKVSADSYRILYRVISKRLNLKPFDSDNNFQNYFLKVAEKQINVLKAIQKYASCINDIADYSAMSEFMVNNLALIELYWMNKKKISKNSLWFRDKPKYQKWHLSNDTESSIALKTGTTFQAKGERNYWWFEEELLSINKNCLNRLFEARDFSSIYSYLLILEEMSSTAIECKEADFYVTHVDWIRQSIEDDLYKFSDDKGSEKRNAFAGIIDIISLLYLDLILESSKIYQKFDLNELTSKVLSAIDSVKDPEENEIIRSRNDIKFYKNIINEVQIEKKRITPDWVIKQSIAKEEYVYLNSLLDIVREGMNHAFSLGRTLAKNQLYFEACIILTRFYEYESKLSRFITVVKNRKDYLIGFQIDKSLNWDAFRLEKLEDVMTEWKKSIPNLLFESSSHFALDNWKNRDDYPDFLGECYNRICEDAVEAITNDDINQFEIDFDNLSKIMLLYQEYIRTDMIKDKDLYRIEYTYYMFTSPIVEWAQIGGLAILWGEFHENKNWNECVKKCSDSILSKGGKMDDLAEKFISYIQNRDRFMFGIGSRDVLETEWNQMVANTIKDSGICESEYFMFGRRLKTNSKLLNAFCSSFMEMGFTTNPSEVFWVICVNPYVGNDKKFRTKYSWEDKLDE